MSDNRALSFTIF